MMQVITRCENQGLVIGEDIHVTVLKIEQTEVRLAISSPNAIPSYREETLCWEPAEQARELQFQ